MTELTGMAVAIERRGDILVAKVNNPPVNALSQAVRAGLMTAVENLARDPAAKALVILCEGRTFIAGADITEFNTGPKEPHLGDVIKALDAAQKPVVAGLHGTALGGGLEVALACSSRVALSSAKMGLPEVKLGILPGSGGTLRLPRLVGAEKALDMISTGTPIAASEALAIGLVDALCDADLETATIARAQALVDAGGAVRRTSDLAIAPVAEDFFATKRQEFKKKHKGFNAPHVAIDLIEAATRLPFAEAVEAEYATCKALVSTPQSQALRGLFKAERDATKVAGLPEGTTPRKVENVAIIGPGTMGRGIAICFLNAGIGVTLIGLTPEALDKAQAFIRKSYDGQLRKGQIAEAEVEARMARLQLQTGYAGLEDVDLALEAVTEDMAVKCEVFAQLNAALRQGAIIATNTSFLDIEALAAASGRPQDFVGMHFFNPANIMKLLENVRTAQSAPDVLATAMALAKRLGKTAVMAGRSEGFIANRMLSKRSREAQFLLEDGASPQQVDKVLAGFGFPIGPFALADLAGMDVMAAARAARKAGMTPREQACDIVDQLVAAGRLGQKNGAGYYLYGEDRKPQPDPAVEAILQAHRDARGFGARQITDEEILERCLLAMVNEAAKILGEGGAARASDIDVVWTAGFGWPRHLGGPMFWADQMGIKAVKAKLDHYAELVGPEYFRPAPLVETLAAEGKSFLGAA